VAPPVFKTGLAGIASAGGFDSLPPPPQLCSACSCRSPNLATFQSCHAGLEYSPLLPLTVTAIQGRKRALVYRLEID